VCPSSRYACKSSEGGIAKSTFLSKPKGGYFGDGISEPLCGHPSEENGEITGRERAKDVERSCSLDQFSNH